VPVKLRRLTHNWRLKLLALGLAVFLWAIVQNEPNPETFPSVPVQVDVADTAWTLAGPPRPATVELRLGGPGGEMVRLARQGPVVRVPVASVGSRDTTIALRRDWVDLGEGSRLSVELFSPPVVHITLERAVTRPVPVSVRLQGRLGSRLALSGPVSLNPSVVRLHGGRSRVGSIDSVPLRPLDLSDVDRSGDFTVAIDTSHLLGIRVTPRTTTVTLRVEKEIERVLPDVPVELDSPSVGASLIVEPSSLRVTLTGASTLVTSVDPSKLRVQIASSELRGMTPGEERHVPVQVQGVPDLVTATPEQDMVTVRRPAVRKRGGLPQGAGR
jgi:YbbR domain-containing protein